MAFEHEKVGEEGETLYSILIGTMSPELELWKQI